MITANFNFWFSFFLICSLLLFREGARARARNNRKPVARFLRWFHGAVTRFLLWARREGKP